MSSTKFLNIAKEMVRKDKALFDSLIEFEKTKKMRTKTRLNFTIDKAVAVKFKKLCRNKGYNMSAKVEQAIEDIVEKNSSNN